ncbi:MAG: hypothetical protein RRZ65_08680 [Tannerellaceae bacterium]
MAKTFVIIDESKVNSFGFRTMIDGVDLKQYKKNPILLWMHQRAFRGIKDEVLPLGNVVNIRVEGEELGKRKLLGDALFDEKDDFAKQIGQKVEDGFIRMVSAGLDPLEWSDAIELKLPGQSRLTLTKSKLFEVSIVDIGSDDGALALWKDGNMITLAAGGENKEIPIYNENNNENKKDMETKAIALKLGLPEAATEQEILDKISICLAFQTDNVTMKTELNSIKLSAITSAVDAAVTSKKINADKKEHFINLGKAVGIQQLNETLALIPASQKPTDVLNLSRNRQAQVPGTVSTDANKLSELSAEDIITLRKDNKEEYIRLYKAEYNTAPRFEE